MVVSIYFLDPSYFGPQSEANPGDCQSFLPSVRNCESSKDCRIGRFHLSESKLRESRNTSAQLDHPNQVSAS